MEAFWLRSARVFAATSFTVEEFRGSDPSGLYRRPFSHKERGRSQRDALMNGFLVEEPLNSRVTVIPGLLLGQRRSNFAGTFACGEAKAKSKLKAAFEVLTSNWR